MADAMKQPTPKINPHQAQAFLNILRQLERVDTEFPLNYSVCLTLIAMNEGISLTQLAEKTGLTISTISRIISALSQYRPNGNHYDLVEQRIAANERRRKELYLTPKGWALMNDLGAALDTYRTTQAG